MPKTETSTAKRNPPPKESAPPVTACPATGLRGAIHVALMSGSYAAYVAATSHGAYLEHGRATPAQFRAACLAFNHTETALLSVGMKVWQDEILMTMGELVRGVDEYDGQIAALASHCENLVTVPQPKTFAAEQCVLIPSMLGLIRPELATARPERIAELINTERATPNSKGRKAAASLWNEAGLPGKRGKPIDHVTVSSCVKRERDRLANRNDDA